jgi:hypothetical protein
MSKYRPSEELDDRAVSALSVCTRKLSNDRRGQSFSVLLRISEGTLSCWSRLHLQSLASTPVSRRIDVRQAAGCKNKCRIFITTWWKHVIPTPLSGIRVGRRRCNQPIEVRSSFLFFFWDADPSCIVLLIEDVDTGVAIDSGKVGKSVTLAFPRQGSRDSWRLRHVSSNREIFSLFGFHLS